MSPNQCHDVCEAETIPTENNTIYKKRQTQTTEKSCFYQKFELYWSELHINTGGNLDSSSDYTFSGRRLPNHTHDNTKLKIMHKIRKALSFWLKTGLSGQQFVFNFWSAGHPAFTYVQAWHKKSSK